MNNRDKHGQVDRELGDLSLKNLDKEYWTRLLWASSLAVNVKGFREMALYQVEIFAL